MLYILKYHIVHTKISGKLDLHANFVDKYIILKKNYIIMKYVDLDCHYLLKLIVFPDMSLQDKNICNLVFINQCHPGRSLLVHLVPQHLKQILNKQQLHNTTNKREQLEQNRIIQINSIHISFRKI